MSVFLTKGDLVKALKRVPDETPLCPNCKAELEQCEADDGGTELYCPNEMCLNEERY